MSDKHAGALRHVLQAPVGIVVGLLLLGCNDSATGPRFAGLPIVSQVSGSTIGAPAVVGDTIFSCLQDQQVRASRLSTGEVLWTTRVRTVPRAWRPRNSVVAQGLHISGEVDVVGVRTTDGTVQWRYEDPATYLIPDLYLATDGAHVAFGARGGVVVLLDAATGAVRWRRTLMVDTASAFGSPVFVAGAVVYLRQRLNYDPPDGEPIAFALDVTTGETRWVLRVDRSRGVNQMGGYDAIVADGHVILALQDGALVSVRGTDGEIRWRRARNSNPADGYADLRYFAYNGSQLVASSIIDGTIRSYSLTDGSLRWTFHGPGSAFVSELAMDQRTVVASGINTQLWIVDLDTHRGRALEVLDKPLTHQFVPSPTLSNGTLVAPTANGMLVLRIP